MQKEICMKKGIAVICCSLLAITSLFASGTSEKEVSKPVTLTFGSHQSGLPNTGIVQDLAKEFESETGIKIDFQISPDAQWRDLIKVKLDSGEAPDIICVDTPINLASSTQMSQYCVDLTNEEWMSRMSDAAVSAVSDNNKAYGITFPGPKMWFVVYNKTIFENLGLKAPTSYDEFKEVCQTILDSGITPIYECTTNGWHQVLPLFETGGLYLQSDPNLYDELNANEKDLDDIPELLTIIKQVNEVAQLGYYGTDYLSNAWENAPEAIASGACAMTIAELGWKNQVTAEYPDFDSDNLGQFVIPFGDNQVIGVNPASNAYFINKSSKHTEEAKLFFAFLARKENLEKRFEGQPDLNALCWPEIPTRFKADENAYIDSLQKARVVQTSVNYIDNQWMDIGKDLESMFIGASTPEDVLNIIMNRRNNQAKLQRDPGWVN